MLRNQVPKRLTDRGGWNADRGLLTCVLAKGRGYLNLRHIAKDAKVSRGDSATPIGQIDFFDRGRSNLLIGTSVEGNILWSPITPPRGFAAKGGFFVYGAAMAAFAAVTLLIPGTLLDAGWALDRQG